MNPLEGFWGTETFLEGLVALGIAFMIVLLVFVTKFWWAILLVLTLGSVAAVIGANIHRRRKKAHAQTVCHWCSQGVPHQVFINQGPWYGSSVPCTPASRAHGQVIAARPTGR